MMTWSPTTGGSFDPGRFLSLYCTCLVSFTETGAVLPVVLTAMCFLSIAVTVPTTCKMVAFSADTVVAVNRNPSSTMPIIISLRTPGYAIDQLDEGQG